MACVYKIEMPSGKSYIGLTGKTAEERFVQHVQSANRGSGCSIHRAIRKYGADSARVRTLLIGEYDYCKDMEIAAIREYGTLSPNGYNLTSGGDGMVGMPQEVIDRRADTLRETMKIPSVRARAVAHIESLSSDPDIESRRIDSFRKYISENREFVANRLMALRQDPEFERKRIDRLLEATSCPGFHKRRTEASTVAKRLPENREKASENSKKMWEDPGHAQKVKSSFEDRRKQGKLKKNYIYPTKAGTFEVKIRHEGINVRVGVFKTEEAAAEARDIFLLERGRI